MQAVREGAIYAHVKKHPSAKQARPHAGCTAVDEVLVLGFRNQCAAARRAGVSEARLQE
jgi:hypothetical protein